MQRRQRIQIPSGEYMEVFWRGGSRQYSIENWERAFPHGDAAADPMTPRELDRAIADAKLLSTQARRLQQQVKDTVVRPLEEPLIWSIKRLTAAVRWLDAKVSGR